MQTTRVRLLARRFPSILPALLIYISGCSGCGDDEALLGRCSENRDCAPDQRCVDEACVPTSGDTLKLDGGSLDRNPPGDAGSDATRDGARDDARTDASGSDALDTSASDGGTEDARPQDASATDATPDAGAGPVPRGTYAVRRVTIPAIPASQELTQIAISPADPTTPTSPSMIVGARLDKLYVVDLSAVPETSSVTISLPKDTSEPILIEDIAYGAGGEYVLVIATALVGSTPTPQGRVYRAGARGQALVELPLLRVPGVYFQAISRDPINEEMSVLGYQTLSSNYRMSVRRYNDTTRTFEATIEDTVSAGCQDLVYADDGAGGRARAFVCGVNSGTIGMVSGGLFTYGPAAGNTSHIAARPQLDYALALSWSSGRLLRFQGGAWSTGAAAPDLGTTAVWNLAFSDDGLRALVVGEYETGTNAALMREYRHPFYSTSEITDVSIASFSGPPWSGQNLVVLNDVAWRPGADCGYIVGGCSLGGCGRGYLIAFQVTNGRTCP